MNKVMLIGNVGKDPDMRYYDADQAIASFPLATTERGYTLPNGTQVPDRTDWHNIVLWRGLAKIAEKYIHKGDKVYIEGKIQYRTYNDKKGQQRFVTEVIGENLELLSPRQSNAGATTKTHSEQQSTNSIGNSVVENSNTSGDTSDIPF